MSPRSTLAEPVRSMSSSQLMPRWTRSATGRSQAVSEPKSGQRRISLNVRPGSASFARTLNVDSPVMTTATWRTSRNERGAGADGGAEAQPATATTTRTKRTTARYIDNPGVDIADDPGAGQASRRASHAGGGGIADAPGAP